MGDIIPSYQYADENISARMRPVIFVNPSGDIQEKAFSLNVPMARELQKVSPAMRTMRLAKCLENVISKLDDGTVIKDIDVLFSPEYKVDVIKVLIDACRRKRFSVIWPGTYEDGKLYYAEEGYRDYKSYDIFQYDITVIL